MNVQFHLMVKAAPTTQTSFLSSFTKQVLIRVYCLQALLLEVCYKDSQKQYKCMNMAVNSQHLDAEVCSNRAE
jgi:hypothetical protein